MKLLASLRTFLAFVFRRQRVEQEMEEELRAHLQSGADDLENPDCRVRKRNGKRAWSLVAINGTRKSAVRRMGTRLLGELIADVRYGLRQLHRNPGFTVVAVLTLGLGIGANTAIFSVVNGVVLQPLSVPHPARVVKIWETELNHPGFTGSVSYPNFQAWRRQNTVFAALSAVSGGSFNLSAKARPVRASGAYVSADFFKVIGVQPELGRGFNTGEDEAGHNQVAVLSDSLWRSEFGSNPAIIGRTIYVNESPVTVIGVAPPRFPFPFSGADIWAPLVPRGPCATSAGCNMYQVFGRLKPGVALPTADAQMKTIMARLRQKYPDGDAERSTELLALLQSIVGVVKLPLYVFLAAVSFVFLIALANVANLLLTRTSARQREISLRVALGAGRMRILRQFLTETLLLALGGAVLGWLIAFWGISLLQVLKPGNLPRLSDVHLDARVLAFTIIVAVIAAIVLGASAAARALRFNIQETLKETGPATTSGLGRRRSRGALVLAEITISLILLAGAGLLIESFWRIEQVRYGLNPDNVLTMRISLPESKYGPHHPVSAFFNPLLEKVRALPGVRSAGINLLLPVQAFGVNGDFELQDHSYASANAPEAEIRAASAGFYQALGIPLVKGRFLSESDGKGTPPVAIVNEALARQYFPNQDPIGQRLEIGGELPWYAVVGVAADVKQAGYDAPVSPEIDVPYTQWPPSWPDLTRDMSLAVRTASNPEMIANSVRGAARSIDSQQPVFRVETMRQVIANSVQEPRFNVVVLGIFAALALVLAATGIYGVLAYSVRQRTHEIGIRIALGAGKSDILRMVLGQGIELALIGVAIGIAGAIALTRFLSSMLYGVEPTDPITFIVVSLILIAVALLACYIPARRATKVDPMVALRYE